MHVERELMVSQSQMSLCNRGKQLGTFIIIIIVVIIITIYYVTVGRTATPIFSSGHASFLCITGQEIYFEHHLHLAALTL